MSVPQAYQEALQEFPKALHQKGQSIIENCLSKVLNSIKVLKAGWQLSPPTLKSEPNKLK